MTQKEFEERVGRSVTVDEYVMADAAYMAAGDNVDKDFFCRLYEEEPHKLIDLLSDRIRTLESEVDAFRARIKAAGDALLKLHQASDEDVEPLIMLMGERAYLHAKLKNDYYLVERDREALLKKL